MICPRWVGEVRSVGSHQEESVCRCVRQDDLVGRLLTESVDVFDPSYVVTSTRECVPPPRFNALVDENRRSGYSGVTTASDAVFASLARSATAAICSGLAVAYASAA